MKKIGLVALFALLLAACDDGGEKKAQLHLQKAETALKQENFNEAKLQIDSIRILYPKAFEGTAEEFGLFGQYDAGEAGSVGFNQRQFCIGKRYSLSGSR